MDYALLVYLVAGLVRDHAGVPEISLNTVLADQVRWKLVEVMNEKIVCLLVCCLLLSGCQRGNLDLVYSTNTHPTAIRIDTTMVMEPEPAVTPVFIFQEDMPRPHKLIERGGTIWVEPTPEPTQRPTPTPKPEPKIHYVGSFSSKERKLFEQVVTAEAGPTWGRKGYFLLAQTTVNQWMDGSWGDTLGEVLRHDGNYSVYSNGRYLDVEVSRYAKEAVEAALSGNSGISRKILYYCTESQYKKRGFHYRQKWITTYQNVMFFGKK